LILFAETDQEIFVSFQIKSTCEEIFKFNQTKSFFSGFSGEIHCGKD
jgi:hypothetical protein